MLSDNDKGFKVSDRRTFREGNPDEAGAAEAPKEHAPEGNEVSPEQPLHAADGAGTRAEDTGEGVPQMDFGSFILSLASATLIHLGAIPDPGTGQPNPDPALAKQTLDILSILQEKTKGNLTEEESRIFYNILADLKMRYLKTVNFIR